MFWFMFNIHASLSLLCRSRESHHSWPWWGFCTHISMCMSAYIQQTSKSSSNRELKWEVNLSCFRLISNFIIESSSRRAMCFFLLLFCDNLAYFPRRESYEILFINCVRTQESERHPKIEWRSWFMWGWLRSLRNDRSLNVGHLIGWSFSEN